MQYEERALRTWYSEVWNKRNLDGIYSELLHPDAVFHTVGHDGEKLTGLKGFHSLYDPVCAAFADIEFAVLDVVATEGRAAARWTCSARHVGDQMGVAPTGKLVKFSGMAFVHFRDGKITDAWDEWDRLGFWAQIGALPSR